MKLIHPEIDTILKTGEGYVPTLVVENISFFRSIISDLYSQTQGYDGPFVISTDDTPVKFSEHCELISSLAPFQPDIKKITSKAIKYIEKVAVSEDNAFETNALIQQIEELILSFSYDLPFSIEVRVPSLYAILRGVDIKPIPSENDLEEIINYMVFISDNSYEKLFVLINFRSFFDDNETAIFLEQVLNSDLKVLLVDSISHKLLDRERRCTIDIDLCEF